MQGTKLMYFKNGDDEAPKGVVELSGPVDLKATEDPKAHGIQITTVGGEAPLMVHAASVTEREMWMATLSVVMDNSAVAKEGRRLDRLNSREMSARNMVSPAAKTS